MKSEYTVQDWRGNWVCQLCWRIIDKGGIVMDPQRPNYDGLSAHVFEIGDKQIMLRGPCSNCFRDEARKWYFAMKAGLMKKKEE